MWPRGSTIDWQGVAVIGGLGPRWITALRRLTCEVVSVERDDGQRWKPPVSPKL